MRWKIYHFDRFRKAKRKDTSRPLWLFWVALVLPFGFFFALGEMHSVAKTKHENIEESALYLGAPAELQAPLQEASLSTLGEEKRSSLSLNKKEDPLPKKVLKSHTKDKPLTIKTTNHQQKVSPEGRLVLKGL